MILGGVRAVVYTDILQVFILLAGVMAIMATAIMEVGGISRVWDIAWEHGRVELWNINPDPLQRHSLWMVIIQGYFLSLLVFGMGQPQVQRICSVSTWNKAIGAHYLNLAIFILLLICCYLVGLSVFAVYADCDPLATGEIKKADQILPFYVIDRLSGIYGLPGLFVASLYAGGLSSYSSQINAVAAVMWEDFLKDSAWVASMREERRPYVNVLVSVITGMIGVVAGIVSTQVGGVFQASQIILGTINAPLLGLFLLGMCCPFANKLITDLVFANDKVIFAGSLEVLVMAFEALHEESRPLRLEVSWPKTKVQVFEGLLKETVPPPYVFPLYLMSYTLYSLVGVSITVFVGAVTSVVSKPWTTQKTGKIYVHPTFYALQRRWEKRFASKDLPSASSQYLVPLKRY
ncbi:Sodium-coupled monocarboxylate transporter 1 [Chionoecetes opilio]|uniref:Sodium-coupled monocarboxylate transporter 1 n=1 Tax=Chionoecetes opilio TaxID=41210 RepID=A0A8J4Y6F7_CHIOP|nr:Sodium-coupled monocarboxylate transporter 1 [Chionoecetes opilio]